MPAVLLALAFVLFGCHVNRDGAAGDSPLVDWGDTCDAFETLDVGSFAATAVRGRTLMSVDGEESVLAGVRINVRRPDHGIVAEGLSDSAGYFDFPELGPGTYLVNACYGGFDELRLRVAVAPDGRDVEALILYLGPSEAPGRRGVVPQLASSGPGSGRPHPES